MLSYAFPDAVAMSAAMDELRASSQLVVGMQFELGQNSPPKLCIRVEALAEALNEKCRQIQEKINSHAGLAIEQSIDPRQARESLFDDCACCVCKISVLPADWPRIAARIKVLTAEPTVSWKLVGQAMGVGLLSINSAGPSVMADLLATLQRELASMGGHLVILRAPSAIKAGLDVWGKVGDSLPVMQAIKNQFDPKQILSPGRFIGGI